jgi:hypothetical protein
VVGNPPYVRPHKLEAYEKEYFWSQYTTFVKKSDLYCCFVERAVKLLLKTNGNFGFIISNGFLRLDSFEKLRAFLLDLASLQKIVEFPYNVFEDATVKTAILLLSKQTKSEQMIEVATSRERFDLPELGYRVIPQRWFEETYKSIFDLSLTESQMKIKRKMRSVSVFLDAPFDLSFGLKTGDDSRFLSDKRERSDYKSLLRGENVGRYSCSFQGEYVWYNPARMRAHRTTARPGNKERFEQPKVLVRDTGEGLRAIFDDDNYYVKDVLIVTDPRKNSSKLRFLTGVLNSRPMRFFYETSFPTLHVQRDELAWLPIPTTDLSNPNDQVRHDRIVEMVDLMLDLHRSLLYAKTANDRTFLQRRIQSTDRQIDRLVYELYGLTDEEIAIVEEAVAT